MQEHPLIELYINVGNEQQNTLLERQLSGVDLDAVVLRTLQAVHISQEVMLTLLLTDDAGIRDMNKQYRDQDKPTDVLSFPLLEHPLVSAPPEQLWAPQETAIEAAPPEELREDEQQAFEKPEFVSPPELVTNLGDIVMSWPTLIRQANETGHEPTTELVYLLSHGVLHLVGYDDHTQAGYEAMVSIQRSVLNSLGYEI